MEIWKDIEGYEGLYQISSEGRVKSLGNGKSNNSKERILKSRKDKDGYLLVNLYKEGKMRSYLVHRLVAQAFLENPNNLPQVNHRNEYKTDNRVENIEYCDCSYNINFGTRNERVVKAESIPILQFSKTGEFIRKWESGTQIEKELGFYNSNICMCCKGKIKTAYRYVWGYEKDYEKINFKVFDLEIYRKKVA